MSQVHFVSQGSELNNIIFSFVSHSRTIKEKEASPSSIKATKMLKTRQRGPKQGPCRHHRPRYKMAIWMAARRTTHPLILPVKNQSLSLVRKRSRYSRNLQRLFVESQVSNSHTELLRRPRREGCRGNPLSWLFVLLVLLEEKGCSASYRLQTSSRRKRVGRMLQSQRIKRSLAHSKSEDSFFSKECSSNLY